MGGYPWAKAEDDWLRENYPKLGPQGCVETSRLNRTYNAIATRARCLNVAFDSDANSRQHSEIMKERWARGVYDGEEYRRKLSATSKAAWERGDFSGEEWRRKQSGAMKVRWERGDFDGLADAIRASWQHGGHAGHPEAVRAAWENGNYDDVFTEEWRRQKSEASKAAWERGDIGGEEWIRRQSKAQRMSWEHGKHDGHSKAIGAAWERGAYDNRTSVLSVACYAGVSMRSGWEVRLAQVFDGLGWPWEYESRQFQYELNGEQHIYIPDFYIPHLDCYFEPHASIWDYFPEKYQVVRDQCNIKLLVLNESLLIMYEKCVP